MSKVELEAKVDALNDEINFLRVLYAAVRTPLPPLFREGNPLSMRLLIGVHNSLKGLYLFTSGKWVLSKVMDRKR